MTGSEDGFFVVGVATRTDNAAESDPATARLPDLWQRASRELFLNERPGEAARPVAVLTDYDSDHRGAYTQVVGIRVSSLTTVPEGLVAVFVPAEDRERVEARGPMPEALITAWRDVWARGESGDLRRGFRTDVEVYTADGADLHLSLRGD